MVKCPFCGYGNEDGALFCEQCKSDIGNVAPPPPPTPMPESIPPVAPLVVEEAPIMAVVVEESPKAAEPVVAAVIVDTPDVSAAVVVAEVPPPPPPAAEAPAPAPAAPAAKPASGTPIPAGAQVKFLVQRGLKINEEYPIYAGENFIGRADEKPVDIDLTFQEPEDRVWCSRQHALVVYDNATGTLTIEDLNSSNGTFVNRERVYPGQPRQLFVGNMVQVGTVHMKVKV